MTDTTFPGFYRLDRATLYPASGSEARSAYEIRNFITSITITESVNNDCIRGTIGIVDGGGLLENYPIRGEENIYIEIVDALGNRATYRWFVYRVDNVDVGGNSDSVTYNIHFTSVQRFVSDKYRLAAAYNQPIHNTVEAVFNKYMKVPVSSMHSTNPNKEIIIEPTDGNIRLIVPRMTPSQAIKMMESRSYSSIHPTCSFRFFESADNFFFVTDEFLYKKAVENNKIHDFAHAPALSQDNSALALRMNNFISIKNISRVDTFDDMNNGSYRNTTMVLNILNRTVDMKEYSYSEKKNSYFAGLSETLGKEDRHSASFIDSVFTTDNAKRFMIVRDYADDDTGQLRGEQYFPEITSNRYAYFKQVGAIRIHAIGYGRSDITCGDFIRLNVPSMVYAENNRGINAQLSGVYMVESIARNMRSEEYTNDYMLIKRDWEEGIENIVDRSLTSLITADEGNVG